MYLIRLAFDNLRFNIKRTLSLVFIIAVASSAIILYQGYVEYCSQGMMTGFISSSGHLQISRETDSGFSEEEVSFIDAGDLNLLRKMLSESSRIKHFEAVLDFNGLAGNQDRTAIFWGKGFDNPEKFFSPKLGKAVFEDDEKILVGGGLAEKLHFDFSENLVSGNDVSLMCNSPEVGICLASAEISGIVETGISQNDEGLLVTGRRYALALLEMEDSASYVQVYLNDNDCASAVYELEKAFKENGLDFSIRTWEELNPSFSQVNNLNRTQFFIISIILGILIFIALTQSLSTAYFERLGEFGTLEAIGMNKRNLGFMLCLETFYMFLAGMIFALMFSGLSNLFAQKLNISMNPPGYDVSYPLSFIFMPGKIFFSLVFVFFCCVLATFSPVISICRNSSVKLINHK